jgi:prepilin-type N-terminal cleavage/methylation domain-containing protein
VKVFKVVKNRNSTGFTILELMIATSVLAVILLLATAVMISIGQLYYKGETQSIIQDNTRSALDQLTKDIQLSTNQPLQSGTDLYEYDTSYPAGAYTAYAFCIQAPNYEVRYSYVTQLQVGIKGYTTVPTIAASQIEHALWRDQIISGSACTPANLTAANPEQPPATPLVFNQGIPGSGEEMVPVNGRLLNFCITNGATTYTPDCPAANLRLLAWLPAIMIYCLT